GVTPLESSVIVGAAAAGPVVAASSATTAVSVVQAKRRMRPPYTGAHDHAACEARRLLVAQERRDVDLVVGDLERGALAIVERDVAVAAGAAGLLAGAARAPDGTA